MATTRRSVVSGECKGVASRTSRTTKARSVSPASVARGTQPRTAAACREWLREARGRGVTVPAYARLSAEELRALVATLEQQRGQRVAELSRRLERSPLWQRADSEQRLALALLVLARAGEPVAAPVVQESACRVTAPVQVVWVQESADLEAAVQRGVSMLPALPYYPAEQQVVLVADVPWEGVLDLGTGQVLYPVAVPACVPQPWAIPVSGSYPVALPVRRTPLAQRLVGLGLVTLLVVACLPLVGLLVALGLVGLSVAGVMALAVRLPGCMWLVARVSRRGLLDLRWWAHCVGHIHGGRELGRLVDVVGELATALV